MPLSSSHRQRQRRRIRLAVLVIQSGEVQHLAVHDQPRVPVHRLRPAIRRSKANVQYNFATAGQQRPRHQRPSQTRIDPTKPPRPPVARALRGPHGVIHGDPAPSSAHLLHDLRQGLHLHRLRHPSQGQRPNKQNNLAHRRNHQPLTPTKYDAMKAMLRCLRCLRRCDAAMR